ncbi:MAG: hypothetical protein IJF98_08470 [Firmicutes bacterium]|nr:hypothetical protein [Bacillota bacterium]
MNPFKEKAKDVTKLYMNWDKIYPESYNKNETDPYTKTRIILMNGTEFEAQWFSRQFARNCDNNDIRRELAMTREMEQQQQRRISALKPEDESILEHTIAYEQLAVDLTAVLAQREPDKYVKQALDFALLEDFDHLYRYSDLLDWQQGIKGENLVGGYTEITPGRPTISEHRCPADNVRRSINAFKADPITRLNVSIITAAEQQTMNYYMNVLNFADTGIARRLYQEIGLVEEEHVSHYESLMDPNETWLEKLLCHEYTECYLYYSCYMDETDPNVKRIWEEHFNMELAHLHMAKNLLYKYENKDWQEVIPNGEFPELLRLGSNIDYVRGILGTTVQNTTLREDYIDVSELPSDADFFKYQKIVNSDIEHVPSHEVIKEYIDRYGMDYRFETKPNPVEELQLRTSDNTDVGRKAMVMKN